LYHHWDYKAAIYETAFNPSFILSAKSESVLDRTPNPLTGIDQEGRNDSTQSTMASQCPVAIETDDKGRRMPAQNLSIAGEIWPTDKVNIL